MYAAKRNRKTRAQSLVEVVVGCSMLLVPLCLFGMDIGVVVITATANRRLCYQAARAASLQDSKENARRAAQRIIDDSPLSTIVQKISLDRLDYQANEVSLSTRMRIKCPAPFPGFTQADLQADSQVYLASKPANL